MTVAPIQELDRRRKKESMRISCFEKVERRFRGGFQ
jgi:hypothetical protein